MKCPYKETSSGNCVHKYGVKTSRRRRKCGFKQNINCPLFLEWMEIHVQEEEKSQEDSL